MIDMESKENVQLKDLHEQKRLKEENDKISKFLHPYASFIVKYPGIMVTLTILTVIVSAVLALVSSAGAKQLPDFSQPTKGFGARGTTIASRGTAAMLLGKEMASQSSMADRSSPTLKRKRRELDSQGFNFHEKLTTNFVFIFKHVERNGNLLQSMQSICKWYDLNIIQADSNNILRSNAHHLPNYIALLYNRSYCSVITDQDINDFFTFVKNCSTFFLSNAFQECKEDMLKCKTITNPSCRSHINVNPSNGKTNEQIMSVLMYNIFEYLTDKEFVNKPDYLQYTSTFHHINWYNTEPFFEDIYKKHLKDLSNTKYDNIEVASFQFQNFKFHIFESEIIVQSLFILTAIIIVVLLIWFYSSSLFIGLMTIASILTAAIVSYFVYSRIFNIDFFPFLNMATAIFMVGIGADDAFVYTGVWQEAKEIYALESPANHIEYMIKWTKHTLRHASLAMFVTSLTTAAAFYANMSSNVTSVKCFGLYSGTAIVVMYLLMITLFPAVVILHEKYLARCMNSLCPGCCNTRPIINDFEDPNIFEMKSIGQQPDVGKSRLKLIKTFINKLSNEIFKNYLPYAIIKLRYFWIIFFLVIGVAGVVITFVKPALRPPSTNEFQMFASGNSLEQYDLKYKKEFRFGLSSSGGNRYVSFIFGVKDVDNGYKFDPDDLGTLEFHQDMVNIADQQMWLQSFCLNLKNASFYVSSYHCQQFLGFLSDLTSPCWNSDTNCCNLTLPVSNNILVSCLKKKAETVPIYSLYFDLAKNVKAVVFEAETKYQYTDSYNENEILFNEMDKWFRQQTQSINNNELKGFWYIEQTFYDLQLSLSEGTKQSLAISIAVALLVIFITSWNIILSLYSIITITFIISVTVGILVFSGWKLNIMESIVFSVAAGLSADFTLHYSVAYKVSLLKNNRVERVKSSLLEIGPAIAMGAVTTFIAGVAMVLSSVLVYIQMAQFLMLVMFISWLMSTFFFLPLCAVIGPVGNFAQLKCPERGKHVDIYNSKKPSQPSQTGH